MTEIEQQVSEIVSELLKPTLAKLEQLHDKVLARISAFETALNLLYADPHQWSERPCQTCHSITVITGVEFGCTKYRNIREGQRRLKDAFMQTVSK